MYVWLDVFGVVVFAITGALAASQKRLDPFGVVVVAIITALGGGTLRDLVLNAHPVSWVARPGYLGWVVAASIPTWWLASRMRFPMRTLDVFDAIGLAFFTVLGTQKTLDLGHGWAVALTMGVMTGVAGGVMRDIICNDIPRVFRAEIYATAAAFGSLVYMGARFINLGGDAAILIGMIAGLVVRLLAIWRGWALPRLEPVAQK